MSASSLHSGDILPGPAASAFSPDLFFAGNWRGTGVALLFGLPIGRYQVKGGGGDTPDGPVFEQTFEHENGAVRQARWLVRPSADGGYAARDLRSGVHAVGRAVGDGFEWDFADRAPTALGRRMVRTHVRYVMDGPAAATSTATSRILGLPMLSLVTWYRRVSPDAC